MFEAILRALFPRWVEKRDRQHQAAVAYQAAIAETNRVRRLPHEYRPFE